MTEAVLTPPRLETERLVLDGQTTEDFPILAAMWADPQTTRHVGGPRSEEDSWMRLLRYRGLWPVLGYGFWAVRDKASGRYAGDLGFGDFRRLLSPPVPCAPEAGWMLAPWAQRRGLAGEALSVALAWFDASAAAGTCHCLIDPENAASLKLAARHGFSPAETICFKSATTQLLTRCARPLAVPETPPAD